jgi:membrane-bound serine protease (ClpP class)
VPPLTVIPTVLTFTGLAAFVVRLAVKAQHNPVRTGVEGITGEIGTVVQDLGPVGKVFVHGELWNATAAAGPLHSGSRVRVVRVDDMMLTVESAERTSQRSQP